MRILVIGTPDETRSFINELKCQRGRNGIHPAMRINNKSLQITFDTSGIGNPDADITILIERCSFQSSDLELKNVSGVILTSPYREQNQHVLQHFPEDVCIGVFKPGDSIADIFLKLHRRESLTLDDLPTKPLMNIDDLYPDNAESMSTVSLLGKLVFGIFPEPGLSQEGTEMHRLSKNGKSV